MCGAAQGGAVVAGLFGQVDVHGDLRLQRVLELVEVSAHLTAVEGDRSDGVRHQELAVLRHVGGPKLRHLVGQPAPLARCDQRFERLERLGGLRADRMHADRFLCLCLGVGGQRVGRLELTEAHRVVGKLTKDSRCGKRIVADVGGCEVDAVQALQGEYAEACRAAEHKRERQDDLEADTDAGGEAQHGGLQAWHQPCRWQRMLNRQRSWHV